MFIRISGLSLLAVVSASIAYQAYKNRKEAIEKKHQARIEEERVAKLAASLDTTGLASDPFLDMLNAWGEDIERRHGLSNAGRTI